MNAPAPKITPRNMLLKPRDWQQIAQRQATDMLGTPEAAEKLAEARRYGALADELEHLQSCMCQIAALFGVPSASPAELYALARRAIADRDDALAAESIAQLAAEAQAAQRAQEPVVSARPSAYSPGEWFEAATVDDMEVFYLSRLPAIREAAKAHGYALGLHGSCRRDFDLIAAPWRDGASDAETLAHAVAQAACGIDRDGAYVWEQKPAGRIATSIPVCWPGWYGQTGAGHIDLSVMPALATPQHVANLERELAEWRMLRDPAILHLNLLRGQPAQLTQEQKMHLCADVFDAPHPNDAG